jgi:hypothetical protein
MQPESGNWGLEGKILVWNEALLKSWDLLSDSL